MNNHKPYYSCTRRNDTAWEALVASGDVQRMNAVLRFLFAAVIIDAHHGTPGTFDYSRIDIEPNPL
jgi:site-specific DNA recombinase